MKHLALGLTASCALGAYLMPQLAGGCLLLGALLVAALILYRKEVGRE
jgi:hypothetical protein